MWRFFGIYFLKNVFGSCFRISVFEIGRKVLNTLGSRSLLFTRLHFHWGKLFVLPFTLCNFTISFYCLRCKSVIGIYFFGQWDQLNGYNEINLLIIIVTFWWFLFLLATGIFVWAEGLRHFTNVRYQWQV